ncbi:hypothetical protein KR215_000199 [Drosophila sulfurigaster]|uniref:Cyclin-dependent kinase inhibitor 1 n=1 Tax=Drosophila albomicans TaxID=7291 RepID=A0A6P8X4I7_DROAB|nr:cyclin-dependent kinase inhibitor 1 [Drosophila albomicans]KAH8405457.1 hypothetical protein KR215_000199 [Drosophila sulfurigaster]
MVSARVFNPVLSELCKMSGSPGVTRNLERIKRNLFGPTPAKLVETTKSPFNAELERHQEMATQKWGFDFRADRPLSANGSFIWERVSSQESTFAPQMYTLTRAAHVRSNANASDSALPSDMDVLLNERADRENLANSSLDSNTDNEYDSQNESMQLAASTSAAALLTASSSSSSTSTQQRKRQLKITEFMKERKRLAQAPKKISPAKRMRTSSGSSSSSASIGSQFGSLLKRQRNN